MMRVALRSIAFAFALALCLAVPCCGLNPKRELSQYAFHTWTQAQGLPQDSVRALAQTPDGRLWVGTDEGLAAFDGYTFTPVPPSDLPSPAIRALCAASDGSLWIGTALGLARYADDKFNRVRQIGTTPVSAIVEGPDRAVWIAAGMHLFRFANEQASEFGPDNGLSIEGIRALLPMNQRDVLIAGYGAVGTFSSGRTVASSSTLEMSGSVPTALLRTPGGSVLVGGTKGLFELGHDGKWRRRSEFGEFIRALARDRDGNTWIGTNSGLLRWNQASAPPVSRADRFAADWIWCIFEDREGTLWIGSNNGLHQLVDSSVAVYGRPEGLPSDEPAGVAQDAQGRIWAGFHNEGAGYLEKGRFVSVLRGEDVLCVRRGNKGDLLIGTRSGVRRISDSREVWSWIPRDELGRSNVFDVAEDVSGTVWLGTNGGLLRMRDGRATVVAPGGTLLDDAVVAVLSARDGVVWAGTYADGLWRLKGSERVRYSVSAGLPSDEIRSLYEDEDGLIWIATFGGGLAVYRNGRIEAAASNASLPSKNIGSVVGDGKYLWIATTRGVVRILRSTLLQGSIAATRLFGPEDGLRSANAAPGYPTASGAVRASDGSLWIPTARGLAQIQPAQPATTALQFPPRIIETRADGEAWSPSVELPASTRSVEIRYAAVHLRAPDSVRYRVQLDPDDKRWIEAGTTRVASFSNLRRGVHRLRVAAALGGSDQWLEAPPLRFTKRPWFYETWWFRGSILATAVLIIWSSWRYRLLQERRRFALVLEERSRLARELHDTLAQGYVGIASQLGAVQMLLPKNPEAASEQVELASRMAQHSLTEARRSIADLRSSSINETGLKDAVRAGVRQIARVPLTFEFAETLPELDAGTAHHLVRIAQEAVANAVKHAAPARITVRLRHADGLLRLSVVDDGKGFDAQSAGKPGHFGLLGMRERAEAMGGTLVIESEPGRGTAIEVQVPAP